MTEQPMQGGYRRPENPAPVSGPGSLSRRTDGQGAMYMSGGEYGEGQEMMDLQNSAPMSKTETRPRASRARGARGGSAAGQQVTSLFAPSERPDEPVTAGMPFGPGPGETNRSSLSDDINEDAQVLVRYLPALEAMANSERGTPSFRRFVRYLRAVSP